MNYLQNFIENLDIIENYNYQAFLLSLLLLLFTILNTFYMIQIKDLKQKTIDLFYSIPQRICWKYYSHCEKFLKYFAVNK